MRNLARNSVVCVFSVAVMLAVVLAVMLVPALAPMRAQTPAPKAAAKNATTPSSPSPAVLLAASPAASANELRARQMLADALADKNPDIRKQSVVALGLVGGREPFVSLAESMLTDKDVYVRLATVATLVDLKNERTVGALQKALYDEAPEVTFAAAKQLWALNDPEGRKAMLAVLSGESKTSSKFITLQTRDRLRMLHTPKTMFLFALKEGVGMAPVPGLGEGDRPRQGARRAGGVARRAARQGRLGARGLGAFAGAARRSRADRGHFAAARRPEGERPAARRGGLYSSDVGARRLTGRGDGASERRASKSSGSSGRGQETSSSEINRAKPDVGRSAVVGRLGKPPRGGTPRAAGC